MSVFSRKFLAALRRYDLDINGLEKTVADGLQGQLELLVENIEDDLYTRPIDDRDEEIQDSVDKRSKDVTKRINLLIEEFLASHWTDIDSPQAERTFGVKRDSCCVTLAQAG